VQVDPIKPSLKAPGTMRLKLEYGKLLSNFAFKFNLRRYSLFVLLMSHWLGCLFGLTYEAGGVSHHYFLTVINARTPLCPITSSLTVCS